MSVKDLESIVYSKVDGKEKSFLLWIRELIEAINGAPAQKLSISEVGVSELFKANLAIDGGYGRLIQDVSRNLDIEKGVVIEAIECSSDNIHIHTTKGTYSADITVVSVPLGVLKNRKIQFIPPLSDEKVRAINRIGYGGVLNKIVLVFKERFWKRGHERLTRLPSIKGINHNLFGYWADFSRQVSIPLLVGFAGGEGAIRMDKEVPDENIRDMAVASLTEMFGKEVPTPLNYRVTRWLSDPFSLGSYSYGSYASDEGERLVLSRPHAGRVFFSGEATEPVHYGTVHGALLSGEREARRIHRIYCCKDEALKGLPWR
jgi:monoamine oxidase